MRLPQSFILWSAGEFTDGSGIRLTREKNMNADLSKRLFFFLAADERGTGTQPKIRGRRKKKGCVTKCRMGNLWNGLGSLSPGKKMKNLGIWDVWIIFGGGKSRRGRRQISDQEIYREEIQAGKTGETRGLNQGEWKADYLRAHLLITVLGRFRGPDADSDRLLKPAFLDSEAAEAERKPSWPQSTVLEGDHAEKLVETRIPLTYHMIIARTLTEHPWSTWVSVETLSDLRNLMPERLLWRGLTARRVWNLRGKSSFVSLKCRYLK